jgi:hypothetical protein
MVELLILRRQAHARHPLKSANSRLLFFCSWRAHKDQSARPVSLPVIIGNKKKTPAGSHCSYVRILSQRLPSGSMVNM